MKIAVVTGGRKGIGLACAQKLSDMGYYVIVTGRGDNAQLPNGIEYAKCDNTSIEGIKSFVSSVIDRYGRLDLLLNNAGVAPIVRNDILDIDEKAYDFCLDTNLKGCFFMTQAVANEMIRLKNELDAYEPRIINISSISAYTSSVNRGEYCISKAGISMVTTLFADRLAEYGIPVFEVRPGIILTDMTEKVKEKYEAMIDNGLTPIKRMGQPTDVAACVGALADGALDFATGQVINADGGFSLRRL